MPVQKLTRRRRSVAQTWRDLSLLLANLRAQKGRRITAAQRKAIDDVRATARESL